jgi:phage tail sheath protein FI
MAKDFATPGVYIQEIPSGVYTISGVSTSNTAFVDSFKDGPINQAVQIRSFAEFEQIFGGLDAGSEASYAILQYFLNGGQIAWVVRVDGDATARTIVGDPAARTGMYALSEIAPDLFNILCLPAAANLNQDDFAAVFNLAEKYCDDKRAFLIMDIPSAIDTTADMISWIQTNDGLRHRNAAAYFPRLVIPDPLAGNQPRKVAASGTLAGVYARTDSERGVWKAPAGVEAYLLGANVAAQLTDSDNGALNVLGINVLRNFPTIGNVSWGARTLAGSDQEGSEWTYIPVRRLALYLEESLYQGSKWANFEPNDELLWSQIRLSFVAFMTSLFRAGAFQGSKPEAAFFVKCDGTTTSQDDIDRGIVNILVGFAPVRPAEFVLLEIQQTAAQVGS